MAQVANYNLQSDLSPVILWQYQNAPVLNAFVQDEQDFLNNAVTEFFTDFGNNVLNLATCNTFGLALWGRLLNTPRPVYNDAGEIVEFTDEQYRTLLRARIYLLTFDGSALALNHFFYMLFPNIQFQVVDNYDMTVDINVISETTTAEQELIQNIFFLPRPSGVEYIFNFYIDYSKTFGFEGQTFMNQQGQQEQLPGFDNGTFYQ